MPVARLLLPAAHFYAGAFAAQHGHRWKSISFSRVSCHSIAHPQPILPVPCAGAGAKAPVIVAGKDQGEVDNDYLLIPVNILDHEGPWARVPCGEPAAAAGCAPCAAVQKQHKLRASSPACSCACSCRRLCMQDRCTACMQTREPSCMLPCAAVLLGSRLPVAGWLAYAASQDTGRC